MDIYQRIKFLREQNNMTQEDLAKKLGYKSRSTINKIEKGLRDINQSQILAFANALQTTPSYLLGLEDDKTEGLTMLGKIVPLKTKMKHIPFIPASVSAGTPLTIESIENFETFAIPIDLLGKYASRKNLLSMKVNGDSMNMVIPDGSYVVLEKDADYKNGDIVVFSNNHEYGIKYYYNDKENERIILRPSSSDKIFADVIYTYDDLNDFFIVGKVVVYTVML